MRSGTLTAQNPPRPDRKNRVRQNYRTLRFTACVLPAIAAAQIAGAVRPQTSTTNLFTRSIPHPLPQVHLPVIEPHIPLLPISIQPHLLARDFRSARADWITCGWGLANRVTFESRVTKLPPDPVLVLAHGYLKCKSIRSALFDPQVSVAGYPTGHFGDYEYASLLVPAWIEISDEANLREIFHTLTSLAEGPDDPEFALYEMEDPELELSDYRRASKFTPELLIEFVGGTDLRIELNFTQSRMLIAVDTRWDFYNLNQPQAYLLRKIIKAKKNMLPDP
jgi:hypothetical protein